MLSFVLVLQTNVLLLSPTFISKGDKDLIYYVFFCKERKSYENLIAWVRDFSTYSSIMISLYLSISMTPSVCSMTVSLMTLAYVSE
jgi:hypothetical protein